MQSNTYYKFLAVKYLSGIGDKISQYLERLQIHHVEDMVLHLPIRYEDRSKIYLIKQLQPGMEALVEGTIKRVQHYPKGRSKLICELQDESGSLVLRFFNVKSFQLDLLKIGTRLRCFSEVRLGPTGKEMMHPEFKVIHANEDAPLAQHYTAVYPTTQGVSQYILRKISDAMLKYLGQDHFFPELLPEALLKRFSLPHLHNAIQTIHKPEVNVDKLPLESQQSRYHQRLVFEELLAHRLSLLSVKRAFQAERSHSLSNESHLITQFLAMLPFQLTRAQLRVVSEINQDLAKAQPMLRLVQGDVGSGKTVVAALSILKAISAGHQAALMAPTELLAEQHYQNFKNWLTPLDIQVVYLSGSIKGKSRDQIISEMHKGKAQVVIGTHALFQKGVEFQSLALIVIDEQHRFGVEQRAQMRSKGTRSEYYPHQLILTATPIPRTLAMSLYADLECSTIDELPPGRTPIVTSIICNNRRSDVISRIREACKLHKQVYWVCPLIDESDVLNCESAILTHTQLQQSLSEFKVGLVHGRMPNQEKQETMQLFKENKIQILVATTVIEVGVDVPNACVMVIENAERLGLSQLHQLRGRVGRGQQASFCLLMYQSPLTQIAKERLTVLRDHTDGFKIAQRDLELRGPGEFIGTRQTGDLTFLVADLLRDQSCLKAVQEAADIIFHQYPQLVKPLVDRWLKNKAAFVKV